MAAGDDKKAGAKSGSKGREKAAGATDEKALKKRLARTLDEAQGVAVAADAKKARKKADTKAAEKAEERAALKKGQAKADRKAAEKAEKKAAEKAEKKAAEKAEKKAEREAEKKKAQKKAAKKADKKAAEKAEKKAERSAEKRFLDQAIADDTALARKAIADAKRELVKERSLVTRKLLKAKELAEKIAAKEAKRDTETVGTDAAVEPIAAVAGAIPGAAAGPQSSGTEAVPVPKRAPATRPRTPRPARTGSSAVRASAEPSESWTMVALRGYAGSKGVTGYSRLNKADLLAKLRGTDEAR